MSFSDTTPKGLILTGLVLASALTTANAAINLFTDESINAKLGKVGIAALFVTGTAIAGATILDSGKTTTTTTTVNPSSTRRF